MFELVQRNVIVFVFRKEIQSTSDNVHMHLASLTGKFTVWQKFLCKGAGDK